MESVLAVPVPDDGPQPTGDGESPDVGELLTSRYSLLASAVSGRRLSVLVGDRAFVYTDGHAMYVPSAAEDAVVIGLVIQSALLASSSLEARHVVRLGGRQATARRFLTLEAARALTCLGPLAPRKVKGVVEGHWEGQVSGSAEESLTRALSREEIPEAPDLFGSIRPRKLLWKANAGSLTDGQSKGRSGAGKRDPVFEADEDEDDEEDSEESKILSFLLKALSVPFSWRSNSPFSTLGGKRKASPDGQSPGGNIPNRGVAIPGQVSSRATLLPGVVILKSDNPGKSVGGFLYPEWNYEKKSYRPGWCWIREYDPAPVDTPDQISAQNGALLRRKLASLGLGYRRHLRQRDGEDLDPAALVEFAVERVTGEDPDERIYATRLRTARDLGILVLLDASGSTAEQRSEGEAVWKEQRQVTTDLVAALDQVGDRVAAYGFYSHGRQDVRFLRIKEFEGRFDHAARRRLAALEPTGFTRIGAAVRHGSFLLTKKADASNLLLVVVSDGFPYDDGYEGAYAEADARRALHEAVTRGIGCVCLSVSASTDRAMLERVWGNVTHGHLTASDELGRFVVPLFRSALKAAAPARMSTSRSRPTTPSRAGRSARADSISVYAQPVGT